MLKQITSFVCLIVLIVVTVGCSSPTSTATPVPPTATAVPTNTATPLPTATSTQVPSPTATIVPTNTPAPLPTATFTSTPKPTATATPATETSVILNDNFDSKCLLTVSDTADRSTGCLGGEYVITIKGAEKSTTIFYPDAYDDFVAEFDARLLSANTTAQYGFWIRMTASKTYLFSLYTQGGYGLAVNSGSSWTDLIEPTKSGAVKGGLERNHVKIIAQGEQIALFVNDQHLDTIIDQTASSGRIGFLMWSKEANGQVAFDNLVVSKINRPLTLPAPKQRPPTATPMPTIPPGMGGLMVTNFYGNDINYEIGGKLYKIPANGTQIILLAPGKYPYSADIAAKGRAGGTIEIQAGMYTTQAWADR